MSDAARRSVEVPTGRQTAAWRRSGAGSGLRRFERSWRDDHLAWICGFANAQGGILEIGKDDNGEIVGVRNVLSLLEDIPSKDPAPHRVSVGAHVKIGDFRGGDLRFQDLVEGDLFTQVDRTLDLLYTKYTRGSISYRDDIYRVETFPVPRRAMREAVINALIHRDYAEPTSTQIRVNDEDIEIRNSALLPSDWVAEETGMLSRPHNPRIAQAFFRTGMIEAWGRGIRQITERCREAGNPTPTWTQEPGGVLCPRFPFSEAYLATAGGGGSPIGALPRSLRRLTQSLPQKLDQSLDQRLAEVLDRYLSQTESWPSWKRSRASLSLRSPNVSD